MNRDGRVVCWHERPLAADEAAVEVDMKLQAALRLLKDAHSVASTGAIAAPPAPGQVFANAGRRLYWPTEEDRRRLERLCPGVSVDAVPWASLHAELEAATPNYIAERDWIAATGPAILMVLEGVRASVADDEAASRGIGEPEEKRLSPARRPTERSPERQLAGEVLLQAWRDAGDGEAPFPGYPALIEATRRHRGVEINTDHLCRARRDLGEHADAVKQWVRRRRLSPVRADEAEPTPGEIEDCQQWFATKAAEDKSGRVLNALPDSTAEFWKHMAACSPEDWEAAFVQFTKEAQTGIR